jgi:hypothetical protein
VVRGATLDANGRPVGAPFDGGQGRAPWLSVGDSGELLLTELDGRVLLARIASASRGVDPVAGPAAMGEARVGALTRHGDGALVCWARGGATAEGDEIRCARLDAGGRARDTVEIAAGVVGVEQLGVASDARVGAVAWQQDDENSGGAVALALIACSP